MQFNILALFGMSWILRDSKNALSPITEKSPSKSFLMKYCELSCVLSSVPEIRNGEREKITDILRDISECLCNSEYFLKIGNTPNIDESLRINTPSIPILKLFSSFKYGFDIIYSVGS